MAKIIKPLIFLAFLCLIGCEMDMRCVFEHTTMVVKLESSALEMEKATVNLVWTWTSELPSGDGIIIERSIGDSSNFIPIDTLFQIETVMYYMDSASVLQPNSAVYYRLGILSDQEIDYFKTADISIPQSQHFYKPTSDTLGDTLQIIYAKLQNFSDCSISIYRTYSTDPESLLALVNPLFDTSIAYPDTTLIVYMPDSIFSDTTFYTIKLSSSKSAPLITDTSIGFRAFFKNP